MTPIIEDLKKLQKFANRNVSIPKKTLVAYGMSDYKINKLISSGYLERKERGLYALTEQAIRVFDTPESTLEKFIDLANKGEYARAFAALESLDGVDEPNIRAEFNFYLYLMSYLVDVPNKYYKKIKTMLPSDVRLVRDDGLYEDPGFMNVMRVLVLEGNIKKALKRMSERRNRNATPTPADQLIANLFEQSQKSISGKLKNSLEYVRQRDLAKTISILESESLLHNIPAKYCAILQLSKDIDTMQNTKKPIPDIETTSTNVYELIRTHNYGRALRYYEGIEDRALLPSENEIIGLLKMAYELSDYLSIHQPSQTPKAKRDTLAAALTALMQSEFEEANRLLDEYLSERNLTDYDYLVKGLVEIARLDKDPAFVKPMVAISALALGNKEINFGRYLDELYSSLAAGDMTRTKLYFEILVSAQARGHAGVGDPEFSASLIELQSRISIKAVHIENMRMHHRPKKN